jgi:hypothetical protein
MPLSSVDRMLEEKGHGIGVAFFARGRRGYFDRLKYAANVWPLFNFTKSV